MDYQIAMLWTRGSLGLIERLCVQSFLDAGHHVVLFTYDEDLVAPAGVDLRNASVVLPEHGLLPKGDKRARHMHRDLFRYRVLAQNAMTIWADMDAYCHRPLQPVEGYLCGWESDTHVGCGVLCLPQDSEVLTALLAFSHDEYAMPLWEQRVKLRTWRRALKAGDPVHFGEHAWGLWGAAALTHFLRAAGDLGRVSSSEVLYPFAFSERRQLVATDEDYSARLTQQTQSVHLFGDRLSTELGEDLVPDPNSLLGRLMAKHGIDAASIDVPAQDGTVSPPMRFETGLTTRHDPPLTGRAAEARYRMLMARSARSQVCLEPLAIKPKSENVTIVAAMKNEGCFILEWIAYHLSIGVTHFVVYTNDCDDPTNEILDRLGTMGLVTRIDNPFKKDAGQKPQRGALNHAINLPEVTGADWVGVIDADEFVNIHVGDGTFGALLEAMHDPNVISMTWRFFGNRGVHAYEDRWQTENFTACAPLYLPKPRLGWGFKSFFRPDAPFTKLGVHRPLDVRKGRMDEVRWVNGSGRVMPDRMLQKNEWFSRKDNLGYDMVTLNHYILRSAESYMVKRQRGRAHHADQALGLAYWMTRNYATETDQSIHRHLPRARKELSHLLRDAPLASLHEEAVAWHRSRIAALLAQDDYLALYQAITRPGLPDAIWRERIDEPPSAAAE